MREKKTQTMLPDMEDFPVPSQQLLRAFYKLTPAEARLAQGLAKGDSLEEIANNSGIKLTTARTHLAAIYTKTGTRRQAKLVAMLARLALFCPVGPVDRG